MHTGVNWGCGTNTTAPVASIPAGASPYGIQDMAGNAAEWIRDYHSAGHYSSSPSTDPLNTTAASQRSVRGGAIPSPAADVRASARVGGDPGVIYAFTGFRCVRSL